MDNLAFFTVQERDGLTARDIRRRLDDWEKRIRSLFRSVTAWAKKDPRISPPRTDHLAQPTEYLMEQFHVRARRLPVLEFSRRIPNGSRSIRFIPTALWVVGANGRMDLLIDDKAYQLMDLDGCEGRPSDWRISMPDERRNLLRFTKRTFLNLARHPE